MVARETSVGVATIRRAELTDDETSMTAANDLAVRRALEAAGASSSTRTAKVPVCAFANPKNKNPKNSQS
jgi:hypothetical protein